MLLNYSKLIDTPNVAAAMLTDTQNARLILMFNHVNYDILIFNFLFFLFNLTILRYVAINKKVRGKLKNYKRTVSYMYSFARPE